MRKMKAMYKCRLCGEIYADTHCGWETAIFLSHNLCGSDLSVCHGNPLSRYDIHICKQGTKEQLGFADFIGFQEEDK